MSKNQSRKERKKQKNIPDTENRTESRSGISKIYYYVIGFLFLVLLILVIFIFTRNGDKVKLEDKETDESALVENNETENDNTAEKKDEETSTEEGIDESESKDNDENSSAENKKENSEEDQDTEELQPGESTVVNEDAPHDANHAVDYNDGSTDRVAIKNEIMAATGLNDDLIEWWVGNDGAGRVEATVSNRDETEIYKVHLQYGDGNWHVLDYERINAIPND